MCNKILLRYLLNETTKTKQNNYDSKIFPAKKVSVLLLHSISSMVFNSIFKIMKRQIKYIYYREVQGSSDRSFKTIKEVHKYAKMMNIENYEVKEVIEITR